MLNADITKTTDSPSWGGLYLQYFEKFDQVQQQKGILSVTKKLFIEKIGSDGKQELLPLGKEKLKTGDYPPNAFFKTRHGFSLPERFQSCLFRTHRAVIGQSMEIRYRIL